MPIIHYHNREYESHMGESVLDTLLRHELDIPYACKAGVCHVCVMVCEQGEVPKMATDGMNESLVSQGNFLACQCVTEQEVTVRNVDECGLFTPAVIAQKVYVTEHVCRLRLRMPSPLYYRAGQFINIQSPHGQTRSYSLASLPIQDDFLELYVKRMTNGMVSNWVFGELSEGDTIQIQGPYGDCFYQSDCLDKNMLMIATGTGLTPIIGILKDAIACGHQGKIDIYHGEQHQHGLFYHQELLELEHEHANIHYHPCVSHNEQGLLNGVHQTRASNLAFSTLHDLSDYLVYLCGSPSMVEKSHQLALSIGATNKHIYIDPFVTKELRTLDRKQ